MDRQEISKTIGRARVARARREKEDRQRKLDIAAAVADNEYLFLEIVNVMRADGVRTNDTELLVWNRDAYDDDELKYTLNSGYPTKLIVRIFPDTYHIEQQLHGIVTWDTSVEPINLLDRLVTAVINMEIQQEKSDE